VRGIWQLWVLFRHGWVHVGPAIFSVCCVWNVQFSIKFAGRFSTLGLSKTIKSVNLRCKHASMHCKISISKPPETPLGIFGLGTVLDWTHCAWPCRPSLERSQQHLLKHQLIEVDATGMPSITEKGKMLASMCVSVELGISILAAHELGCSEELAIIACVATAAGGGSILPKADASTPTTPRTSAPGTPQGSRPATPRGSRPGIPQQSSPFAAHSGQSACARGFHQFDV
jgi:HrpA-like RNA helicase